MRKSVGYSTLSLFDGRYRAPDPTQLNTWGVAVMTAQIRLVRHA